MRVVVVTGQAPHHRNLCAKLFETGAVVGIIHPAEAKRSFSALARQARKSGWGMTALYLAGKLFPGRNHGAPPAAWFAEGAEAYARIPGSIVHSGVDVRQRASADLLASLRPDATLCMGGPIYPKAFVNASPLTLNFHSGVSPIYNGTASIQFAFANGHPHLCGGTLMKMSAEVDGGLILGHYLPEVGSGDTPGSLFAKTARGAAILYARFIEHAGPAASPMRGLPQPRPLFYTRGFDLGWQQKAMIARNVRGDVAARHARAEAIAEYWREESDAAAQASYRSMIDRILWAGGGPAS